MEDVWIGPRDDENGEPLDMSSSVTYMVERLTYGEVIDSDRYSPNLAHPSVQEILRDMPTISPTIMFRLCMNDCRKLNDYFRSMKWKKPDSDGIPAEEERSISDVAAYSQYQRDLMDRNGAGKKLVRATFWRGGHGHIKRIRTFLEL